jgi:putative transposase
MRLTPTEAIYQKPNLSLVEAAHKIYPYLLRNLLIENIHQVGSTDITYIPMKQGYLCAVVDWCVLYFLGKYQIRLPLIFARELYKQHLLIGASHRYLTRIKAVNL